MSGPHPEDFTIEGRLHPLEGRFDDLRITRGAARDGPLTIWERLRWKRLLMPWTGRWHHVRWRTPSVPFPGEPDDA
jgi:hypothetical protein